MNNESEPKKPNLRLVVDNSRQTPESGRPAHIDPTSRQRERAIEFIKSEFAGLLLELDEHIRPSEASKLACTTEDPNIVGTLWAAGGFGSAEWLYVAEARHAGPDSAIFDTAHWIVANAIAREEYPGNSSPTPA